ncbi:hypothetical protein AB6A40_008478 [Gnathostoma spinigerum]|uniref:Uncharacterized protein n=1 Tax=Gnathostoma spinigerum TaxID=75299 RepID=A0ABD6EWX8_9BILA
MCVIFLILFLIFCPTNWSATCTSDQYCPRGWSVRRIGKEYAAMTCEPGVTKCPKPYQCVMSHCEMNFCCANDKMLEIYKIDQEERAMEESSEETDAQLSAEL